MSKPFRSLLSFATSTRDYDPELYRKAFRALIDQLDARRAEGAAFAKAKKYETEGEAMKAFADAQKKNSATHWGR
jgi:hypothetical protein